MNYSAIKVYDVANGPGLRVSLFVSGCDLHCSGCFNPEAQDFNYGEPFDTNAQEVLYQHLQNPNIVGLSLLGGDPLCQSENDLMTLANFAKHAHLLGKTVWLWSGYTWEYIFAPLDLSSDDTIIKGIKPKYQQYLVEQCDVLVDGPFIEAKKDLRLKYCGSTNQRVLDVKKSLENKTPIEISY